jgi:hypothetical protein
LAQVCLQNLLHTKNSKYYFRYRNILDVPQVRTTTYGKRSFRFAAASLWNSLPDHFRDIHKIQMAELALEFFLIFFEFFFQYKNAMPKGKN